MLAGNWRTSRSATGVTQAVRVVDGRSTLIGYHES